MKYLVTVQVEIAVEAESAKVAKILAMSNAEDIDDVDGVSIMMVEEIDDD